MKGAILFLTTWFVLGGMAAFVAHGSILPLIGVMIALAILGKVAKALEK